MSGQPKQSQLRAAGGSGVIPLPRVDYGPALARPNGVSDASWAAAGWWAREMARDPVVDAAGARRFRIELSRCIEGMPHRLEGGKLARDKVVGIEFDPEGVLLEAAHAAKIDYRFGFPRQTSMSITPEAITVTADGRVLGHVDVAAGGGEAQIEYDKSSIRPQFEGPGG